MWPQHRGHRDTERLSDDPVSGVITVRGIVFRAGLAVSSCFQLVPRPSRIPFALRALTELSARDDQPKRVKRQRSQRSGLSQRSGSQRLTSLHCPAADLGWLREPAGLKRRTLSEGARKESG